MTIGNCKSLKVKINIIIFIIKF